MKTCIHKALLRSFCAIALAAVIAGCQQYGGVSPRNPEGTVAPNPPVATTPSAKPGVQTPTPKPTSKTP